MSDSDKKTRVVIPMPKARRSRTVVIVQLSVLILLVGVYVGLIIITSSRKAKEAVPMAGDCVDVPMRNYASPNDKDGKSCLWKGLTYFCAYDPNKDIWFCNVVDPQPAEKKQ